MVTFTLGSFSFQSGPIQFLIGGPLLWVVAADLRRSKQILKTCFFQSTFRRLPFEIDMKNLLGTHLTWEINRLAPCSKTLTHLKGKHSRWTRWECKEREARGGFSSKFGTHGYEVMDSTKPAIHQTKICRQPDH